jgi:hypothetical protein
VVLGADIPHRRLRPTDQDQKQALGDLRLGQVFFCKVNISGPMSCGGAMRADTMSAQLIVRPTRSDDFQPWLMLWRGSCASLDGTVPDTITEGVWRQFWAPDEAIWCLLACQGKSEPVGLANYVLHPHTWSLQTICYLRTSSFYQPVAAVERDARPGSRPVSRTGASSRKRRRWRTMRRRAQRSSTIAVAAK